MKNLFKLDHPLWKMMAFLSDCMILTLIWVVFSLPIVTIGPSLVALFYVGGKLNDESGKGVIREFITAFLEKFKKSFWMGVFLLLGSIIIGMDLWYFHTLTSDIGTFLLFVFIFLGIIFISNILYVFPLLAITALNLKEIMKVSFYMMMKHFKWTMFMLIIDGTLLFVTIYIAPYISFFTIGALAYLNMKVLLTLLEENDYSPLTTVNN